jgi:phage gpG-like protein
MAQQIKVIDRGWSKIVRELTKAKNGKAAAVGFQGDKGEITSPDHGDMTNVELGAIHEFGTRDGRLPERPMIRQTFDGNVSKYKKEMDRIGKEITAGKNVEGELLLLGEEFKNDIMKSVRNDEFAGWAESTIAAKELLGKAGGVPLWVTGQLMNALTTEVVDTKVKKSK